MSDGDIVKKAIEKDVIDKMQEENKAHYAKEKQEIAEARAAARRAEKENILAEADSPGDREGRNAVEKLSTHADSIINARVTTVNDWKSSMMDLLIMLGLFVKAFNIMVQGNVYNPLKELFIDKGVMALHDAIKYRPDGKVDLPSLQHEVKFTNDNKLDKIQLTRSDKGELNLQINESFRKGVTYWLQELGYEEDPSPDPQELGKHTGVFRKDGVQLTTDEFNVLKASDEKGLGKFLSVGTELEYTEAPTAPIPTPFPR